MPRDPILWLVYRAVSLYYLLDNNTGAEPQGGGAVRAPARDRGTAAPAVKYYSVYISFT